MFVQLAGRLGEAFFGNSVHSAAAVIVEEKSSASLVDRLDEVASRVSDLKTPLFICVSLLDYFYHLVLQHVFRLLYI